MIVFALEPVGAHCSKVTVGRLVTGYSYETIVMFDHPSTGLVVSENIWSQTTAKHIKRLGGDQVDPTPYDEFARLLHETFDVAIQEVSAA